MQLTTKGRYAVMAMADMAFRCNNTGNVPVSLAQISERQDISLSYLEQLFVKLRRAGLVDSVRGPGGGYKLARNPEDILIFDIMAAVDEPVKMVRCVGDDLDKGCVGGERCLTHGLWASMGRHLVEFLQTTSLSDVIDGSLNKDMSTTPPAFEVTL